MKCNVLLVIVFLLLVGCSTNTNWTHTMVGEGNSWSAVMEIRPTSSKENVEKDGSTNVEYKFKLAKKTDKSVSNVTYEAFIVRSNNGGKLSESEIRKINQKEVVTIFTEFPNYSTPDLINKDTTKEELATYFSDLRIVIKWEDGNGENIEEIFLKVE